ncbi:hypothetical protein T265_03912 [Opisthorchis viverrini]|uniref:Uncharacterized protein n=1 Tax=Opisthorchis viverrini TaxID=6198 RepID=A0A074ZQM9_OPIVI|nr:hypothetical protein T265_03912 [Opisthorchis viverrini]KER29446.1 hypothetical protein T265_03912 [Opisthorchis viverrini]
MNERFSWVPDVSLFIKGMIISTRPNGIFGGNLNIGTSRNAKQSRSWVFISCLGLSNLAVSHFSCFLLVAWQLGTKRVLQLNDGFLYCTINVRYQFTKYTSLDSRNSSTTNGLLGL